MRRLAILSLILLFAGPVAAQEVGDPRQEQHTPSNIVQNVTRLRTRTRHPSMQRLASRTSPIPLA